MQWDEHQHIADLYRKTIERQQRIIDVYKSGIVDIYVQLQLLAMDSRPVPNRLSVQPGVGYIYVIQELKTRTCKIGFSRSYKNRSSQFAAKLPFLWETVALFQTDKFKETEAELHKDYDAVRVEGEWFCLTEIDLLAMWRLQKWNQRYFGQFINRNSRLYTNDLYVPQNRTIGDILTEEAEAV